MTTGTVQGFGGGADFRTELEKSLKLDATRHAAVLKTYLPLLDLALDRATTFEKPAAL